MTKSEKQMGVPSPRDRRQPPHPADTKKPPGKPRGKARPYVLVEIVESRWLKKPWRWTHRYPTAEAREQAKRARCNKRWHSGTSTFEEYDEV